MKRNKKEKVKFSELTRKQKILKIAKIAGIVLGSVAAFLCIVVAVVAIVIRVHFGVWIFKFMTPNNFKAGIAMLAKDRTQIEADLNQNYEKQSEVLGVSTDVVNDLNSGNYTEEEMLLILNTNGTAKQEIDRKKHIEAMIEQKKASGKTIEISPETIQQLAKSAYTDEELEAIIDNNGIIPEKNEQPQTNPDEIKKDPVKEDGTETVPPENTEKDPPVSEQPEKDEPKAPEVSVPPVTSTPDNTEKDGPETPPETTTTPTPPPVVTEPQPPVKPDTPVVNVTPVQEIINRNVAKLYVVKNDFITQLSTIEKTIRRAYCDLPIEQQVPASRKEIARQYVNAVADLELKCDAQVDAILAQMKTELEAIGADTSVVETIRTQYEDEKALKKAYYLDVFQNGLPDGQ